MPDLPEEEIKDDDGGLDIYNPMKNLEVGIHICIKKGDTETKITAAQMSLQNITIISIEEIPINYIVSFCCYLYGNHSACRR